MQDMLIGLQLVIDKPFTLAKDDSENAHLMTS